MSVMILPAGGAICPGADVTRDRGASGNPLLGQEAFHLPVTGGVALRGKLFPDRPLAIGVGRSPDQARNG